MQQAVAPNPLAIWLQASRPKTLAAAFAPVWLGAALAIYENQFHLGAVLAALLGATLIQIGTNFANDYFDFRKGADTHERVGPARATASGWVKPQTMLIATIIVFTLAFIVGMYLVMHAGWPILLIGILSILFGILYTGGPFPLGYNGWGDIFAFLFFGPIAVAGTYYVQALEFSWVAVLIGIGPGLFSVALITVNNLRDREQDAKTGKRTLAVRLGAKFAQWEYVFSMLSAILILPLILWGFFYPEQWLILLGIICLIPAWLGIRKVFRFSNPSELNQTLGLTGISLLLYSLLISMGWIL